MSEICVPAVAMVMGTPGGRLAYLAADALDHGFARAVCAAQETQKLFGI